MAESLFVCREKELASLDGSLDLALAGQGRVVFVTGEPGSGKSALMGAFARQAQERVEDLIVVGGICNDQSGVGEPYLPFREILATLVGEFKVTQEPDPLTLANSKRIKKIVAQSGLMLLEVAPTIVEVFFPQMGLISTLGAEALKQYGLGAKFQATVKPDSLKRSLSDASLNQENVFEQFTQYLLKLSAQAPLLISLDDLQWADPSSLGLLFHLGRRLDQSRVLILGSYRQDEVALGIGGERHPLEKLQAEFMRQFGEITIALEPDDTPDDRRLVHAILDAEPNQLGPEFRQLLCRHTEGNPLFVRELLRAMQERGDLVRNSAGFWVASPDLDWTRLPARIQGVIQERIDRLESSLRQILDYASVQGERFAAEVIANLQQVAGRELVAVLSGELSRRHQLIAPVGTVRLTADRQLTAGPAGAQVPAGRISLYRFTHNLVQKYLYNQMDPIELNYLHEDVGLLLEQVYAADLGSVAAQLAWHFSQAGVEAKAAYYALLAGEQALADYAYTEALEHLNRGLELIPPDDLASRYRLILAREMAFNRLGRRQAQQQDLETLAELAKASGQPDQQLEGLLRQVQYHLETGDYALAHQLAQQAINRASQAALPEPEVRGCALLGRILFHQGQYDQAREWLELAEGAARDQGFTALLARSGYDLGMVDYFQGRYHAAVGRYSQAMEQYQELGNKKGQVNCLLMQGTVYAAQGAYGQARQALEEALETCRRIGWRRGETYMLGNLGSIALNLGQLEEAQSRHEWALEICREVSDREGEAVSLDTLGLVQLFLGYPEKARAYFQLALAIDREIGYQRGEGFALTHLGHAHLALDQPQAAADSFRAASALRRSIGSHPGQLVDDRAGLASALLALGDLTAGLEQARQALNELAEYGPEQGEYPICVYVQCLRVLQAAGDPDAHLAYQSGLALLHQQADSIQDQELRRTFLERVPFNRELQAYQL